MAVANLECSLRVPVKFFPGLLRFVVFIQQFFAQVEESRQF